MRERERDRSDREARGIILFARYILVAIVV
jgi:hypothetical protein